MSNLILKTPFFSLVKRSVFYAGEVAEKHNGLFYFAANITKQKNQGFGDPALSRIAPCFGAAVTAEAVIFRDNAAMWPAEP